VALYHSINPVAFSFPRRFPHCLFHTVQVDDLIDMKAIEGAKAGSSTTLVCSSKEVQLPPQNKHPIGLVLSHRFGMVSK